MVIKIEGLSKVIKDLDFEKSVDKLTQDIMFTAANILIKLIQKQAPRQSGEYAKSWVIQRTSAESITIGSSKEKIFLILEYGRGVVRPTKKKVLHWIDPKSGEDVFVMLSKATKPQPHLRPALARFEKLLPDIVAGKISKHWKPFEGQAKEVTDKSI